MKKTKELKFNTLPEDRKSILLEKYHMLPLASRTFKNMKKKMHIEIEEWYYLQGYTCSNEYARKFPDDAKSKKLQPKKTEILSDRQEQYLEKTKASLERSWTICSGELVSKRKMKHLLKMVKAHGLPEVENAMKIAWKADHVSSIRKYIYMYGILKMRDK